MRLELTADDLKNGRTFDWALRTARRQGDEIILAPGVRAETRGSWAFPEFGWIGLAAGVSLHLGEGAELVLSKDAVRETNGKPRPNKDLNLLWAGDRSRVTGGRFNANGADLAGWNCGGLRFFGRFEVADCEIVGLAGKRSEAEVFAISAEGATGGSVVAGVTVRDCFTDSPQSYVSGIYMGATVDNGEASAVRGCSVALGDHGQFAFASSFATVFSNCRGEAMRFWYTDTGPGIATIDDCQGVASYSIVGSVATEPQRREIAVRRGTFVSPQGRAVEWWDKGGRNDGFVAFIGSTISAKYGAASAAAGGALIFSACRLQCEGHAIQPGSPRPIIIP